MSHVKSTDLHRKAGEILDRSEHKGEHVAVTRYDRPAVVVVPASWYEKACHAIATEGAAK